MIIFTAFRFDRTPERLALAQAAVEAAFRLRPDGRRSTPCAGETIFICGHLDYNGALERTGISPPDPAK